MIILYVLPVLTLACGIICKKGRFKGIYCLLSAVFLALFTFFFRGSSFVAAEAVYDAAGLLSPEEFVNSAFPPGMLFSARLFYLLNLGSDVFAVTALTVLSLGFGYYIHNFCKNPVTGMAVFVSLGFSFLLTEDISLGAAVLITCFGMKYMEEKRFFRFCGYILLAACFSPMALLLIPIYFLLLPDKPLIQWALSIAIAVLLILLPVKEELFRFVYLSGIPFETRLPVYFSAVIIVFAVIFTLMSKMIQTGKGHGCRFLGAFSLAAALSVAAILDGRLLPLFVLIAVPSILVLFSEGLPLILALLLKTFPEKRKTAYIAAVSVFSVTVLVLFTLSLFSGVFSLPVLSVI